MPLKPLEDLIYEAAEEAKVVMKTEKTVPVRFIGILPDGDRIVINEQTLDSIGIDLDNTHHKNLFAYALRATLALLDAVQYLHYSEAWSLTLDKLEDRGNLKIEDDPRRFEIVHYTAEDKSGRCVTAEQGIIRPAGKDPELDHLVLTVEAKEIKGRFHGVLNYQLSEEEKKSTENILRAFKLASRRTG